MKTPEQLAVEAAFKSGQAIEARDRETDDWFECVAPTWRWAGWEYRVNGGMPQAKKKLRPWLPGEVPVGAYLAFKKAHSGKSTIIRSEDGFVRDGCGLYSVERCMNEMEWSRCGQVWTPCGVME